MGNDCSCGSPVNISSNFIPRPSSEKYVEDFLIVWFNPSNEKDPTKTKEIKEELQKQVNLVVICTDAGQCNEFISGIGDEKVFLVVSDPSSKQAVSIVSDSPKIDSTYYLNDKLAAKTGRIRRGNEVCVGFGNIKDLCKQMKQDIKRCERYFVKPRIVKKDPEKILFMYDQLLQEIILTSKKDDTNDVLNFFKRSDTDNPIQLEIIKKFTDTYSKDLAVQWYTKECGLYRRLNNAFRERKYKNLYELHVFIRHLHEQIVLKSQEHPVECQMLYRGQHMDTNDFNHVKESIEKLIFFPSFLSTSIKRDVAMRFAQKPFSQNHQGKQMKVLFEINIGDNVSFPCADIRQFSEYSDEEECLFSVGSTYRVDNIETIFCDTIDECNGKSIHHEIQVIKMTLIDDKDEQLILLKKHLQDFVKDENICVSFGRLMYQIAKWDVSEFFYTEALEKEKGQYHREAAIRNNLGSIAFENKRYDDALEHYEKAIELEEKEGNVKSQNLVFSYQNTATVYYKQGRLDSADNTLQKAIDIHNRSLNGDWNTAATIYNNMAHVLNSQGKHDQALINNRKCLRIRRRILPKIHPSLAIAYNSMAITFNHLRLSSEDKENSDGADEYAQNAVDCVGKAVNIDHQSLPSDHPQTLNHQKNLKYLQNGNTQS